MECSSTSYTPFFLFAYFAPNTCFLCVAKATNISGRTSIHDRPTEADGRRFGDFDMDLVVDVHGHAILVLLELMIGFVMMERLLCGKRTHHCQKLSLECCSHIANV